jgi:hypothetical protein
MKRHRSGSSSSAPTAGATTTLSFRCRIREGERVHATGALGARVSRLQGLPAAVSPSVFISSLSSMYETVLLFSALLCSAFRRGHCVDRAAGV